MDAESRVKGRLVAIWGRNATIGTAVEELYAYDQPLDWSTILSAAAKMDVTSSSTADTSAGTGAQKIKIVGLDANYLFLVEEVTMNGQTIVTTAGSFLRVFAVEVSAAGTGRTNAGDIHVVKTGTGGSYTTGVPGTLTSAIAKVLIGWGGTMNGIFTVPAGRTYELAGLSASAITQAATLLVASQALAGANALVVEAVHQVGANLSDNWYYDEKMLGHRLVWGEKTDIRLRAIGAAASSICAATMYLKQTNP